MYEDWGRGGGLVWGTVVSLIPGRSIDFLGHLSSTWGGPAIRAFGFREESRDEDCIVHVNDTTFARISAGKAASTREGRMSLIDGALRAYVESRPAEKMAGRAKPATRQA